MGGRRDGATAYAYSRRLRQRAHRPNRGPSPFDPDDGNMKITTLHGMSSDMYSAETLLGVGPLKGHGKAIDMKRPALRIITLTSTPSQVAVTWIAITVAAPKKHRDGYHRHAVAMQIGGESYTASVRSDSVAGDPTSCAIYDMLDDAGFCWAPCARPELLLASRLAAVATRCGARAPGLTFTDITL